MAPHQEHTTSSKKLKRNKVPQRGMGVAQLQKIIAERDPNLYPGPNPLVWPQFHAQGSSMVNASLEPPSNQSYCANKSFRPHGDKMIGMKRSYPFSMENIPPVYLSPVSKLNGSTTRGREDPSPLGSITDQKTKKFIDENLPKDFLTLAPPQSSVGELIGPSYQGRDSAERDWLIQQALHCFFPVVNIDGISNDSNGDVKENVDLDLKL